MNIYQAVEQMDALYANNPSYEDKIILVMKVQSYTDKQSELFALENIIKKELKNNNKLKIKNMLVNNYEYSTSGAYSLISRVIQKQASKID